MSNDWNLMCQNQSMCVGYVAKIWPMTLHSPTKCLLTPHTWKSFSSIHLRKKIKRVFGLGVSQKLLLKTHNSNLSLISQNSILQKTQNWKFLFSSNISKPCPTSQYSTFSLFGGAHSMHRLEEQFSLVRVLFSLLSPKILFCLPISTHTPNVRTRFYGFSFSFSFSTLLPPYLEDPSPANS